MLLWLFARYSGLLMEREVQVCPELVKNWQDLTRLAFLPPGEKSRLMQSNVPLMMSVLDWWEELQADSREENGSDELKQLLSNELRELKEEGKRESRLVESKPSKGKWWEWDDALERWKVVSEMADVVILLYAWLKLEGVGDEELKRIMEGQRDKDKDGELVKNLRERAKALGMDLEEAVILKTGINLQHRPPSLEVLWRENGFMKRMRSNIGDETSQMPDLGQAPWGPTVLTMLQAKEYASSEALNLVVAPDALFSSLDPNKNYGGLYR